MRSPSLRLFCSVRYSIAKWMPDSSRPGTGRSRGRVDPPASTIASKSLRNSATPDVDADVDAGPELDPFLRQQVEPPVEEPLLELELRDAVAEQAADPIGALEHGDPVAGAIELRGGGQAGRARTDHRDALAGAHLRLLRGHPALVERAIDDRDLDRLDRHRIVVDAEDARSLARRRAQPAR